MIMLPSWKLAKQRAVQESSHIGAPFIFYKEGDWWMIKMSGNACMDGTIKKRPMTIAFPSGEVRSYAIGEDHSLEESKC